MADSSGRATPAQRQWIERLLKRHGYATTGRCSVQWRPLFKAMDRPEPKDVFDWPNADEVIYGLTVVQGSALINHLIEDN
ncbi:MAG: hypothetical protein V4641_05735 [Pseudomonadota bacterium]